jgi:hypothetical protein
MNEENDRGFIQEETAQNKFEDGVKDELECTQKSMM